MSLTKVLYYGFKQILFSPMVNNNECDLPETLLFDTWALCSLQRKFRVDVAALCTAMHVQWLLGSFSLETSAIRDKAIQCVIRNFLAVSYGERVSCFGRFLVSFYVLTLVSRDWMTVV
jgi:hypothetical protein